MNSVADTTDEQLQQLFTIIPEQHSRNVKHVEFTRTFMSAVLGAFAGIVGLEGVSGFLLYFLGSLPISLALYLKCGPLGAKGYFVTGNKAVLYDGIMGNLLSFVLFWTFFTALTRIYS